MSAKKRRKDREKKIESIRKFWWDDDHSRSSISPTGDNHEMPYDIGSCCRLLCGSSVVEIGCGNGRLAPYFEDYLGLDVSPERVARAQHLHPDKRFELINFDDPYPHAQCYLFCHVLLHVPELELDGVLARVTGPKNDITRVVIAEVMNPIFADGVICFHRTPDVYRDKINKSTIAQFDIPYNRYQDLVTFLVCE